MKFVRYGAVSIVCTLVSLTILATLLASRAMTAGWANMTATGIGTIPSFELNRRWVWDKQGQRSVRGEVGPFFALSFAGLALSSVAVHVVAGWAARVGMGTTGRTIAAEAANVATFGTLWVAQFVILDRVLFRSRPALHAIRETERV